MPSRVSSAPCAGVFGMPGSYSVGGDSRSVNAPVLVRHFASHAS